MNKNFRGFTLLEMVVVLAVIAILAAVLTPIITSYVDRARVNAASTDLKSIAAAIIQFNTDTRVWPIYAGTFTDAAGTVEEVMQTTGIDGTVGSGTGWALTTAGDLDDPLNRNTLALPTTGPRAWKGAYLQLAPDPWGTRYYLTARNLKPGSTSAGYVLSAGQNQTIETIYSQPQGGILAIGGDDMVVRIK